MAEALITLWFAVIAIKVFDWALRRG